MNISMIPNNDVKTIHASQGDTERVWHFVPYANEVIDTSQDEFASINSIRGNTLVWNQLWDETMIPSDSNIYSSNTYTSNGITFTKNGDGSISVVGTATADANVKIGTRDTIGLLDFKHLIKGSIGGTYIQYSGFYVPNEGAIRNASASYYNMWVSVPSGTVISTAVKVYPQIFNLDKMFGTNIPTLDEFKALFPLPNYVRDQGSLLSFNGTGIKTVGKNLLDESTIQNGYYSQFDGSIVSSANYRVFEVYLLKGTYTISTSESFYYLRYWDGENHSINASNTSYTFTLSENATVLFCMRKADSSAIGSFNMQVEFGSTATSYEPYTENTTTLPISTYFPTGMKSAGSVYDELTPTKAITRVGLITLNGSEAWAKANVTNPNGNCFELNYSVPFKGWGSGGRDSAVSNLFTKASSAGNQQTEANNTFWWNNARTGLRVVCSASTADEFKALLQSTPLQIQGELATPSEQDISEDLTYPVYAGGTEQLLPSASLNGQVDLGSLTWTYNTANSVFYADMPTDIIAETGRDGAAAKYSPYDGELNNSSWKNLSDKQFVFQLGLNLAGRVAVVIKDTSFTDVSTFTASLSGVMMWYEKSDTNPGTTPMDANIQYPDEARDVYFTYKQSEFESRAIKGSMVCKGLEIEGETDENGITIQSTSELTSEAGFFDCKLKLTQGDDVCYSSKFQLHVEKRP